MSVRWEDGFTEYGEVRFSRVLVQLRASYAGVIPLVLFGHAIYRQTIIFFLHP